MKITLLTLFASASVALAAKYPVSISTTNGTGFGTTVVNSLAGKINTGDVTNASGDRVAYISDITTGGATNAIGTVYTNGVALIPSGATNINFVAGANTTVTGSVVGATAVIGISSTASGGTTYTNNTDIAGKIIGSGIGSNTTTFAISASLGTAAYSNSASFQNASATLSNVVSQSSNRYVGSFTGLITTGNATNASGIRVAYLSDTNGLGGGGTTYTNNSTGTPGTITGSGISTNLATIALLSADNIFTGTNTAQNLGVPGILGAGTATTAALDVTGAIHNIYTNSLASWDANGLLKTNSNLSPPSSSAVVGQVLTATSTAGVSKWDYVNQVATNSAAVNADFNKPFSRFTTNAAFLWLAPANVDTTLTKLQVADVAVTNSTAAAVLATFNGTVRVTGTPYITNVTYFHWRVDPWMTNCLCEPVF